MLELDDDHPHLLRFPPPSLPFLIGLAAVAFLAPRSAAERIEQRSFSFRTRITVRCFAEQAETITAPLNYPQLQYVVPDGSLVEKGTVITEFDQESIERRLADLEHERVVVQADLKRRLTDIRNRDMALHDELAGLQDNLSVLEVQLERYRSIPEEDDVAIAKGRLKVARLEFVAAEKDFATAERRFEKGMISPAEIDREEKAYLEKRARVAYREGMLRTTSRPTHASTIRQTELRITNVELEIGKLQHEIAENAEISKIGREGANTRVETLEERIEESREDLAKTTIEAPISGHVMYLSMFRKYAARTGHKMWKNFAFMRIPDQNTLAFKGVLLESERRYFSAGDLVTIQATGHPEETLTGTIESFSTLSHDRSEKDEDQSRHAGETGVMVYDVVIKADLTPAWLRVGITAECELTSSTPIEGPAIPASYIKAENGDYHLALDGVYQHVTGTLVDGHLVIDDQELLGRDVTMFGTFPEEEPGGTTEEEGGFHASGELQPADTANVAVERVHGWPKVAWLIDEDKQVSEGTVIAKLDPADTNEEIKKRKARVKTWANQRKTEAENIAIRARENEFYLERAGNLLEIEKLSFERLRDQEETAGLLASRLSHTLATIRLDFLNRRIERVERTVRTALSPLEIARLKRDRRRAELQLESAKLRLDKAEEGVTPLEQCQAEFDHLSRELSVSTYAKRVETENARNSYMLRRAERYERRYQERLDSMLKRKENLVIRAPRAGLAQYSKVYSGGVWAKITVGSQVGQRVVIMEIADVTRMFIRLAMPEKHYTRVSRGLGVDVRIPSLTDTTLKGRVTEVEFLFQRKKRKDGSRGLYSSHETLGESIFFIRVEVDEQQGVKLKPGAMAEVIFPFET